MKILLPGEPNRRPARDGFWSLDATWTRHAPALMLLYGFAFFSSMLNVGFNVGDEGIAAVNGWRILMGEIPHRDFFEIIPPFSFLPTALFFKWLGPTIAAERLLVLLYALLLPILADRILAKLAPGAIASRIALIAVLIPFGVPYWPMPSHHWVVDILQLGAMLCLLKGLEERPAFLWGGAAGLLSALACFSLQDQGAYFVLAAFLFVFPWIGDARIRRLLFLGWTAGGLLIVLLGALYLLPHVSLADLAYQWIEFPASRYKNIPENASSLWAGWQSILYSWSWETFFRHPFYVGSMLSLTTLIFMLPFAGVTSLGFAYWFRWADRAKAGILLAGLLAFVGGCLHRWALTNLTWCAPAPLICLLWASWCAGHTWPKTRPWLRFFLVALSVLGVLASALYWRYTSQESVVITTPAGTVRSVLRGDAKSLQETLAAIEAHTSSDTHIAIIGYMPLVSFLAQRPNPTPFNFFGDPRYNTPQQESALIAGLEKDSSIFVLVALPFRPGLSLDQYLMEHYRPVWRNDKVALLRRNISPPPR